VSVSASWNTGFNPRRTYSISSVCPLATSVYCGKTADAIEMPFGTYTANLCNLSNTNYHNENCNKRYHLAKVDSIIDLGVRFDSKLAFLDHMIEKVNKAYSILGIIKRNFIYLDTNSCVLLYKAMVRPHLEYANSVWCPYKKGDI